jgi:hypothetical protein
MQRRFFNLSAIAFSPAHPAALRIMLAADGLAFVCAARESSSCNLVAKIVFRLGDQRVAAGV